MWNEYLNNINLVLSQQIWELYTIFTWYLLYSPNIPHEYPPFWYLNLWRKFSSKEEIFMIKKYSMPPTWQTKRSQTNFFQCPKSLHVFTAGAHLSPSTYHPVGATLYQMYSHLTAAANDYGSLIIATNTGLLITVIILFNSRANLKTHCSSFTCHLCCCFHPVSCLCSSPWPGTLPKCAALLIAGPDSYQFQAQDEFGNMATINQWWQVEAWPCLWNSH